MQDRVKETSNFNDKQRDLDEDCYHKDITEEDRDNGWEALNQELSTKMIRLLKKSSRTRPELTKALGLPSELNN